MADIFISYAHEDSERIKLLASGLASYGRSVFWDRTIPPGKTWRNWIGKALAEARCVVVAWSEASIHSEWVCEEAEAGKERNILIPVFLGNVRPPMGFRAIQGATLVDWNGQLDDQTFQQLVHAVADILGPIESAPENSLQNISTQTVVRTLPVDLHVAETTPAPTAAQPVRTSQKGGVELALIPGGRFLMGSPEGFLARLALKYIAKSYSDDECPQHQVEVPAFYLGRYPVTYEEYARFKQANPDVKDPWGDREFNQARQPVVGVLWEDACRFAEWAGGRLPTEAEWEYAARAGTTTRYWWGDEVGKDNANCAGCGSQWDGKQTAPVGSFQRNPFGVHEMLGNVWEWVQDCWHESYKGAPTDGSAWGKQQGGDCGRRVIRGGSWVDKPGDVRSASRLGRAPDEKNIAIGFRLAQDI